MNRVAITDSPRAGVHRGQVAFSPPGQRAARLGSRTKRRIAVAVVCGATAIGAGVALVSGPAVATGVTAAALVPLAVYDVRERRIPKRVVYPASLTAASALLVSAAVAGEWGRLGSAVVACLLTVAALTAAWWLSGVGFGDVRLGGLVSLTAGWHGAAVSIAMWWWIAVMAAVVALLMRVGGHKAIPLAPAIAAGWAVALVGVA